MSDRPNLIEVLLARQAERGHLDDETLRTIARDEGVPLYRLEGLVSFYPHFRRTPPPALEISVCRDAACRMRGANRLLEAVSGLADASQLGADAVGVESVSCLGRCDGAPACLVDGEPASVREVARALGAASADALDAFERAAAQEAPVAFASDPYSSAGQAAPGDAGRPHYDILREWLEADAPRRVIERLEASGLRGMGGAGFPTGRKWALVADQDAGPKSVICNADESEPGTFKDREILTRLPHLVVEGLAMAGLSVGAERGIVFVRHEYGPETRVLREELDRARACGALGDDVFGSGRRFDVEVFVSPGGYVLGEETALLEALEGRRGEPRNKPPYPGVSGLHGRPTLIQNVETLSQVPRVAAGARADLKFFSVSGDVERPGVLEAPLGTSLGELIDRCGGMRDGRALLAFLPGGASTGFLTAEHVDLPLEWDALREAGSALGSGAVTVIAEGRDLREVAGQLTAFFRNESCGKCVPCRIGTEQAVKWIEADAPLDVERLSALAELLADTSICGLGQAALLPITSLVDRFGPELQRPESPNGSNGSNASMGPKP